MRETRSKTGKLAMKAPPKEYEDADFELEEEYESKMVTEAPAQRQFNIFGQFNTKQKLQGGLCVLLPVGGHKYEIVNLDNVNMNIMGSEEVGNAISSNHQRLEAIENALEGLKAAQLSLNQGFRSANRKIFRFEKLPIELRYKVYDITILSKGRLIPGKSSDELGLGLRATCHTIYEETFPFFYRNNFAICGVPRSAEMLRNLNLTGQNIREVSFDWWAWAHKDPLTLSTIAQFPKLETLHIILTHYCIDGAYKNHRQQIRHQQVVEIKKFSHSNGFDAITKLRGLKNVIVSKHSHLFPSEPGSMATEIKALQDFLNFELTKPRKEKEPVEPKKKKRFVRSGKTGRKSRKWDAEDEEEFRP